jgi:hypothetical protein
MIGNRADLTAPCSFLLTILVYLSALLLAPSHIKAMDQGHQMMQL